MRYALNFLLMLMLSVTQQVYAQSFYFGADLSYANEMQACGATFKVAGAEQDPYFIFKDHGCNLVRLRLWHTPSWYDQLNEGNRYSDFEDVRNSIIRAKNEGMEVLLDFHLSDTWADPGHQVAPAAWTSVLDNLPVLQDSLYNYIYSTLSKLAQENLLPEIVQIGNETNRGILLSQQTNDAGWSLDWPRNSALFNSAIDAVRDIQTAYSTPIKIALHIANPNDVVWYYDQFWTHGVQDFDIMGISYYYDYHPVLIPAVGSTISYLKNHYPGKEVMILETAYQWTQSNADGANNLLYDVYPGYPPSIEHQRDWMIALTQEVINSGGTGVVYWEPDWVSTSCSTQWIQGSSWDNATFFDFDHQLQENGGIGWMSHPYDFTLSAQEPASISESITFRYVDGGIRIDVVEDIHLSFPCLFKFYAVDGKMIQSQSFATLEEMVTNQISLQGISNGIYSASLRDKRGASVCGKICVMH